VQQGSVPIADKQRRFHELSFCMKPSIAAMSRPPNRATSAYRSFGKVTRPCEMATPQDLAKNTAASISLLASDTVKVTPWRASSR
jgi:hypothetical protein